MEKVYVARVLGAFPATPGAPLVVDVPLAWDPLTNHVSAVPSAARPQPPASAATGAGAALPEAAACHCSGRPGHCPPGNPTEHGGQAEHLEHAQHSQQGQAAAQPGGPPGAGAQLGAGGVQEAEQVASTQLQVPGAAEGASLCAKAPGLPRTQPHDRPCREEEGTGGPQEGAREAAQRAPQQFQGLWPGQEQQPPRRGPQGPASPPQQQQGQEQEQPQPRQRERKAFHKERQAAAAAKRERLAAAAAAAPEAAGRAAGAGLPGRGPEARPAVTEFRLLGVARDGRTSLVECR